MEYRNTYVNNFKDDGKRWDLMSYCSDCNKRYNMFDSNKHFNYHDIMYPVLTYSPLVRVIPK